MDGCMTGGAAFTYAAYWRALMATAEESEAEVKDRRQPQRRCDMDGDLDMPVPSSVAPTPAAVPARRLLSQGTRSTTASAASAIQRTAREAVIASSAYRLHLSLTPSPPGAERRASPPTPAPHSRSRSQRATSSSSPASLVTASTAVPPPLRSPAVHAADVVVEGEKADGGLLSYTPDELVVRAAACYAEWRLSAMNGDDSVGDADSSCISDGSGRRSSAADDEADGDSDRDILGRDACEGLAAPSAACEAAPPPSSTPTSSKLGGGLAPAHATSGSGGRTRPGLTSSRRDGTTTSEHDADADSPTASAAVTSLLLSTWMSRSPVAARAPATLSSETDAATAHAACPATSATRDTLSSPPPLPPSQPVPRRIALGHVRAEGAARETSAGGGAVSSPRVHRQLFADDDDDDEDREDESPAAPPNGVAVDQPTRGLSVEPPTNAIAVAQDAHEMLIELSSGSDTSDDSGSEREEAPPESDAGEASVVSHTVSAVEDAAAPTGATSTVEGRPDGAHPLVRKHRDIVSAQYASRLLPSEQVNEELLLFLCWAEERSEQRSLWRRQHQQAKAGDAGVAASLAHATDNSLASVFSAAYANAPRGAHGGGPSRQPSRTLHTSERTIAPLSAPPPPPVYVAPPQSQPWTAVEEPQPPWVLTPSAAPPRFVRWVATEVDPYEGLLYSPHLL